ncbi:MAG: substrate-binding domain-containing protein [Myxococcales bacterium]|nr:substrate-binding domain-containing protein [Myxococcales bacterium]MCB9714802.1 substrate-binding domain-containing protein [Myxococcales bacterium]
MADAPPHLEPAVPDPSGWGGPNRLWLAVSLSMLALLGVAAWLVVSGTDQPLPPFLRAGGTDAPPPARHDRGSDGLRLAGSGSNLPMTRALNAAFPGDESRHPVVHASIGSGGGVRALLDGVIDVALVSRPLREGEREQGLVAIPYARVPIVVAVHTNVPDRALSAAGLVEIYEGRRTTWSDGSRIVVLQRERDDSSHMSVNRLLPAFEAANVAAYNESRWRVLYRDDFMREALAETRGAIGLFGQGAIPTGLPIAAVTIDGVAPSPQTVRDGSYPYTKDLAFVTRGPPQGEAAAFIDFTLSPEGRRIIEQEGGVPLAGRRAAAPDEEQERSGP